MSDDRFDENALAGIQRKLGPKVVAEIIGLFFGHAPEKRTIVIDWEPSGDLDPPAAALHSLKSSAAMLGAAELHDLADKMERLAKGGDKPGFSALVGDFDRAYADAEKFLREYQKGLE